MAKILIVDDTVFMRVVLQHILERAGHQVISAVGGQDALQKVVVEMPDLVIMDQNMPKMTGVEALCSLRADPRTRTLPVILASSDWSSQQVQHDLPGGSIGYVEKPFQVDRLLAMIQRYLDQQH